MASNLTTQQSSSDENATALVPVTEWIQEFGTNGYDSSNAVAVDGEGNVYVTGITEGDLGGINNGKEDIWLSKYDSKGKQLWIEQWGTAFADSPGDISVDRNGNVYIAASSWILQENSLYANESALIKYDANGNLLSALPQTNTIKEIEVDGAGNLYILGLVENKWFVRKNDSNGDRQWIEQFNSSVGGTLERLSNLRVSDRGDVYFGTSINLDGIFTQRINRIVKYNSAGREQWFQDFWDGFLPDIHSDSQGNLYAFGSGELSKYNSNGNLQWQYQWEDKDGSQFSEEVGVDRDGNVYVIVNIGGSETQLIKLDTTGNESSKQQLNLTASILDLEIDGDGKVAIAGRTKGDFSDRDFDAWVGKFAAVAIAPANNAPTDIGLDNNSIAENSQAGTVIGQLTTTDSDSDGYTYTLLDNAAGRFAIEGNELKVADGSKLDFEASNSHALKIRTTDNGTPSQSFEKEFSIKVTDINDSTVKSSNRYTLRGTEENLKLTGIDAINGTGNNLDNRLRGNNAKNRLRGKGGKDVLIGRGGNDTLIGGGGGDRLIGNRGNDLLDGGVGNDTLTGGGGSDRFLFNTGNSYRKAPPGRDVIRDFKNRDNDKIILDKTTFGALDSKAGSGFSVVAEFDVVKSDRAAANSDAIIVYNENNGKLFYNANGSNKGLGAGGVFAVLDNSPQLQANDFILRT